MSPVTEAYLIGKAQEVQPAQPWDMSDGTLADCLPGVLLLVGFIFAMWFDGRQR